jgi:hypothetical protein
MKTLRRTGLCNTLSFDLTFEVTQSISRDLRRGSAWSNSQRLRVLTRSGPTAVRRGDAAEFLDWFMLRYRDVLGILSD